MTTETCPKRKCSVPLLFFRGGTSTKHGPLKVRQAQNAAGIATANEHVHIFGERKPTHNGGSHVVNEDIYHVSVDGEYFKGKQVILFDDLLTSGKTIEDFRRKLEAAGAYVEREIFLARTIHHDPISNRGVLQEMAEGFYEAVAHSKRCFPQGVNINKKSNNNYNKVA